MQKIVPFLWFNNQAEEAMKFYVSVFKNSRIVSVNRIKNTGPELKETVTTCAFELEGQLFYALNGGPHFTFNPAISLFVNCNTQQEVDELWDKLIAPGEKGQCGWLKDKFGVSWQIIPVRLGELMNDKDPEKAARVVKAMMQMHKIETDVLEKAYNGK